MIISFFDSALNRKGIGSLKSENGHSLIINFPNFEFDQSDKLTLVSLNADGSFQNLIAPQMLAAKLLQSGLPASIKEIEIIVSDIDKDNPLLDYAMRLGKAFFNKNREITIKAVMSMEGETLIVPPDKESGDWRVYLINRSSDAEGKCFDFYCSQPKTLLFEGKIQDFLQEDCVITPKEISSSSQQAEISQNPFYQPQ
ncbi:hypothetical protein [Legionella maioricensis]|uniref:Uncharacterized protein n=1 Tax=Legionella maioricensis TaxID=2896528 RepID=A0A9X2IBL8_9GAMM|nr:hypothetical protein [Legionella maioricensis]MCL9684366.1 hypothetical protein [Legionella maioricensis]MCL9687547.1 hypothetical protein [Legionella maioricensis]